MTRRSLAFFTDNTSFDVARARELLGFRARHDVTVGLRETLARLTSDGVLEAT